jgi:hypothetical protein
MEGGRRGGGVKEGVDGKREEMGGVWEEDSHLHLAFTVGC